MMAAVYLCYKLSIFVVISISRGDEGEYSNTNSLANFFTMPDPYFFNKSLYDSTVMNLVTLAKVVTHSQRYWMSRVFKIGNRCKLLTHKYMKTCYSLSYGMVIIQLIMVDMTGYLTPETTSSKSKTSSINSFHAKLGSQEKVNLSDL